MTMEFNLNFIFFEMHMYKTKILQMILYYIDTCVDKSTTAYADISILKRSPDNLSSFS